MANELEALEKRQLSAQRSLNDLTNQLTLADHLVYKKYLAELQNYGMVTLSQEMLNVQNAADCIRMYQLKELTLKKGEDMFQKLSTVYYSSMAQGCSLAVMIDVPEENVGANIYLGIREEATRDDIMEEEGADELRNRILIYERGSALTLLNHLDGSLIWITPLSAAALQHYGLTQRRCQFNRHRHKDCYLARQRQISTIAAGKACTMMMRLLAE